jgi:hypothetical protein
MTTCSPLSFNRRFGGTYCLHLQGRRNKFSKNLFFRPWRWRRYVLPKSQLTLKEIHGVISQKMVLFITTAVRTSNPTCKTIVHKLDLWFSQPRLWRVTVFWDLTQRSQVELHRRFGGTAFQVIWLLAWINVPQRQYVPPKRQWTSTGLHGVTCQKMEFFTQFCFPF